MNRLSPFMAIALASAFALSACGEAEEAQVEAPDGIPGLEASNGRLVLAPVAGNPAAVYFDLSYSGDKKLSIDRVDVAAAKNAMLHTYGEYDSKVEMMEMIAVTLENGQTIEFKPGDRHVMAFEISPDLAPGDTTEVTLTKTGGDKYSFPVEVRAAGDER